MYSILSKREVLIVHIFFCTLSTMGYHMFMYILYSVQQEVSHSHYSDTKLICRNKAIQKSCLFAVLDPRFWGGMGSSGLVVILLFGLCQF